MKNIFNTKVYYKDTDAEGVVYYAKYLEWMEVGRTELINDLGLSLKKLKEEKKTINENETEKLHNEEIEIDDDDD